MQDKVMSNIELVLATRRFVAWIRVGGVVYSLLLVATCVVVVVR